MLPARAAARLESALEERAISLGGDPVYGLLLHNGAAYVDAQLFAHLALRRLDAQVAGAAAGAAPAGGGGAAEGAAGGGAHRTRLRRAAASAEARRAILRQVATLGCPVPSPCPSRSGCRRAFLERPDLDVLVRPVRSRPLRRFILQQTVLASLVEGGAPPRSWPSSALARCAPHSARGAAGDRGRGRPSSTPEHRSILDVFTVTDNAVSLGDEWVGEMQRSLDESVQALVLEARMMGELSVFLGKLAIGQRLTSEERRRMRPGADRPGQGHSGAGDLRRAGWTPPLAALAKVLPFSLLPSAFHGTRREVAAGAVRSTRCAPTGAAVARLGGRDRSEMAHTRASRGGEPRGTSSSG